MRAAAPIDGRTGEILPYPTGPDEKAAFLPPAEVANQIGWGWFPTRAAIYKRSSFERAGGYLPELRWLSDWFMALVIALRDGVCHLPECLAFWTALPTAYSAQGIRDGAAQREVMAAALAKLTSPEYADVAPWFWETGVLAAWGPDLVRAAAERPDRCDVPVLGLISGLSTDQYEELLRDDDPEVRALASVFLGPLWRLSGRRRERLEARFAAANDALKWMKTSKFWKMREACVRVKRTLAALAGRRAAGRAADLATESL